MSRFALKHKKKMLDTPLKKHILISMMKLVLFFVWALMSASAFASSSYCWQINDNDRKNFCLARTQDSSYCWQINNNDRKNYCLGMTNSSSYCWQISNNDLKNQCLAFYN